MKSFTRLFAIITFCFLITHFTPLYAQEIYVAPKKSGAEKGTLKNPYTELQKAAKAASDMTGKTGSDVAVYLRGGIYTLDSPVDLTEDYSGKDGHKITFMAYEDEKPVISGGVRVSDWEQVDEHIFKAPLSREVKLRSLFVNGNRKRMAGTDDPIPGYGDWGKFEVDGSEPWAFGAGHGIAGIKFLSEDIDTYENPEDIELVQFNIWTEKILCAQEIVKNGDTTIIKLQQPSGAIATSMAWAGKINYSKLFVIRNAYELLDSPGEFYFNKQEQMLYYYSDGEDMGTAEVIAPTSQGLLQVHGSSTAKRVENIGFEGITFSYDDWPLMEIGGSYGFAGIQSLGLAVKFLPDGNWHPTKYNSTDVPRGAIDVKNASNISFIRNRFEGINSAIAINLVNDVVGAEVKGNLFYNTLGNAVNVGHPQHYEIGDGDIYGEGEEGVCKDIEISNNYLRSVCLDFRQVEGITAFFVEKVRIEYNDIRFTPYGAITCGWWWGNAEIPPSTVARQNSISYNRAGDTHQILDDGGILYALGEQPNSIIKGNYIFNGPRSIYPDDGSAYWTISENVVDNPSYKHMWLHLWSARCHDNVAYHNYVKNNFYMDNGTDNIVTGTYSFRDMDFSDEANEIIDAAGIQEAFKDVLPAEEPARINIFPKQFKEGDRFH